MKQYGVMLDSGLILRRFLRKADARKFKKLHNDRAREQKARGAMVSLRYAIGIVTTELPNLETPAKKPRAL